MLQTKRFGILQRAIGIIMFIVNGTVTTGGGGTGTIIATECYLVIVQ